MPNLTREQVYELARLAGIELDEKRADTISARLNVVFEELDMIPAEALADIDPLPVFTNLGEARDG